MRVTEARVLWTPATEEGRFLLEGPREVVVSGAPALAWVNIQTSPTSDHGEIYVAQLDRFPSAAAHRSPARPGFLAPVAPGNRAIVGQGKELRLFDLERGAWQNTLAAVPDDNPRTIINDAEIVPSGKAIVFGTKDLQFKEPIANLYLYTVDDNRVSLLADRQTCSNGKVFRTEGGSLILYDIDTPTRKVLRYRLNVAGRTASPDGTALDIKDQAGFPDGMCDCGDGTVIIAFYNPDSAVSGRAVRFDLSTGSAIEEWLTPGSPRVTCPLLVKRPEGVKLILTTATEGMPQDLRARCPNAGCLFIADTQLPKCPDPELIRLVS
jgi:sugar lactone lactonase YvrE